MSIEQTGLLLVYMQAQQIQIAAADVAKTQMEEGAKT